MFASVLMAAPASAHGAMMVPGSRTFLCWKDGLSPQGNIVPQNPACAAAVATSGDNSLYNWFSVLRSDGAGRTRGFVSDGQLCSGGNPNFTGFNVARADFPVTHLTSGARLNFKYNKWAAHPGWFYLYITKDSWSPTRPLAWNDLEEQPFLVADHPADTGAVGSVDGNYYWSGNLPSGKSGRHIIYSVWQRSDSNETFYGCSDVVFDGGNGEVTGVGQGGGGGGGGGETPPPATGACTATYSTTGSWSGGFQAEVRVTNTGTSALNGWTVSWPLATGQSITSLWNGTYTPGGSVATVRNAGWNRTVATSASTTFGFTGNGGGSTPAPTCTSP
ncbi:lytic polysaccharide monooxygenase [Actinomadura sp. HBU206391]|uniref:lytic polysaccharide monooxygenase auxiliary activity family 9 protein n=1 Tax=Actinomadura sp. HBU206391 TaxID=2731692 RepID=UPI0021C5BEE2|nr:lytic polysaccharide monooxygenase [Actinomadura sp. HBU206391]